MIAKISGMKLVGLCIAKEINMFENEKSEDMSKIITQAKAEFNAYTETRIREIGIEALKKDSVKFLETK